MKREADLRETKEMLQCIYIYKRANSNFIWLRLRAAKAGTFTLIKLIKLICRLDASASINRNRERLCAVPVRESVYIYIYSVHIIVRRRWLARRAKYANERARAAQMRVVTPVITLRWRKGRGGIGSLRYCLDSVESV